MAATRSSKTTPRSSQPVTLQSRIPSEVGQMTVLRFSVSAEATGRIYELLVCLAKFGETVSLEAKGEKLTFTALNLARTAYASFALDSRSFFISYDFRSGDKNPKGGDRFTCQLLNKALQSVFKGRTSDPRNREIAVERCDVSIQDQPDKTECRLIIKMLCKHGLTKTYRLTYESAEVMHALFDKTAADQGWKISSRILREYIEFFGPKTEQLDLVATEGKAIFTSFTERIQDGKEALKQPMETSVSIHTEDFEDFHVQENVHVVISVKDFKAIVTHAETLKGLISAHFSHPSRPLQFSYQNSGIRAEFTLMTGGDYHGSMSTPNPNFISSRSNSQQQPISAVAAPPKIASEMPPPSRPVNTRQLGSQSQRTSFQEQNQQALFEGSVPDEDSLFMPGAEDDQTWDPQNFEDEEDEVLGWDASIDNPSASFHQTFRDSNTFTRPPKQPSVPPAQSQEGLEPTQRLSQLHGLFD